MHKHKRRLIALLRFRAADLECQELKKKHRTLRRFLEIKLEEARTQEQAAALRFRSALFAEGTGDLPETGFSGEAVNCMHLQNVNA